MATRFSSAKMSRMFAVSHLEPSEMKISEGLRRTPSGAYAFSISASIRKPYPCSGPYPMKVFSSPSSETASWNAFRTAGGSGRVTSPIPRRMMFAEGFAAANVFTLRPISGNRYPAFSFR